jgi:hypothetical protein
LAGCAPVRRTQTPSMEGPARSQVWSFPRAVVAVHVDVESVGPLEGEARGVVSAVAAEHLERSVGRDVLPEHLPHAEVPVAAGRHPREGCAVRRELDAHAVVRRMIALDPHPGATAAGTWPRHAFRPQRSRGVCAARRWISAWTPAS